MFEFAISQHQRRPLSRRFRTAVAVSILSHIAVLIVLVLSPAGPLPGLGSWLRPLAFLALAYFLVLLALARGGRAASEKELFEFAISQHQRHPPSRRFLRAVAVSILAHIAAVVLLIQFPSLLLPGLSSWLRPLAFLRVTVKEPDWRMVSMLGNSSRMQMPSAETLRKLLPKRSEEGPGSQKPSVPIRWGDDKLEARDRAPVPRPLRKPVPGTEEPKPAPQTEPVQSAGAGDPARSGDPERSAGVEIAGTLPEKKPVVPLPPPSPEPKQIPKKVEEVVENKPADTTPSTPDVPPKPVPGKQDPKVFENEQKAIRSEGTGFFDTKGFPLGEYATLIIERIKGNWFIPSNLRNNQGRSTLVFYIEKDGQVTGIRLVSSSGSKSLDDAAYQSVWGSKPFPPLPKGFPGEHVGAKFVFSYNEVFMVR
jgi:periplasmic protein TonB